MLLCSEQNESSMSATQNMYSKLLYDFTLLLQSICD